MIRPNSEHEGEKHAAIGSDLVSHVGLWQGSSMCIVVWFVNQGEEPQNYSSRAASKTHPSLPNKKQEPESIVVIFNTMTPRGEYACQI